MKERATRHRFGPLSVLALAVSLLVGVGVAVASAPLTRLSSDPYTNAKAQHQTEVEPDTFAFGTTIVAAFQAGRFAGNEASNIGFATSVDGGSDWTNGFLPGTTKYATPPGASRRITDPSVAYDAKHHVWIISSIHPGAVVASRSTDGGLSFQNPITVTTGGDSDKDWIVCDNTPASPFYGNCYVQWDDHALGNRLEMNTSSDGGMTWSPSRTTADSAKGIGGQPLVAPNGTVVVPVANATDRSILYFTSSDGGASWSAVKPVASIVKHGVAGSLRAPAFPSAEIDRDGRVFVAWQDCRFRSACSSNDIVYATIDLSGTVSAVQRVPIDPVSSTVDHFTPGLAVDNSTGGGNTHLAVTYYYYPVSNCGSNCQLDVGFVSSSDGGSTWSSPIELAGPMLPTWLANTKNGRMYGDYISTSYVGGNALPVIVVANAPTGGVFDEAVYTPSGSLAVHGSLSSAADRPVPNAASDEQPADQPLTAR
jgi:hypothetical protein